MKLSTKLKALCAALAVGAASAASASPIYLDVGTNFAPGADKVNATSTSVKNEVLYTYQSTTTVFDTNASGTIDAGDAISTNIGLFGTNILANNRATGFNPGETFGTNADNGYGDDWVISFSGVNLLGTVSSVLGGVPLLSYAPGGVINMLLTFDGSTYNNFMDLVISGGAPTGLSTILLGVPDFSAVDAGFNNLFHAAGGVNCAGNTGFKDLTDCAPPIAISFEASQDTNVLISQFTNNGDGTFSVSTNHDGSLTFSVPEPSMLLLMGGALLGLGLSNRRRATRKA
ncbi:PEP-CTERM sorting domain-containing protein [Dechloromonas sp. A34]|uniref:PEP-CTERM sorting domain-containing protein n=1 Tax=Dechloromonas sp. A34 TaxID=447588 RepID=UPI002248DF04|nr:PEP-CTERM sorting domain-containing protein [Dechloromonas sp. A34]